MVERPLWLNRIRDAWQKVPVVWLCGVRRVGKTTLAKALPDTTFINCDLPEATARLAEPDLFFRSLATPALILDEVHQLPDPSRVLKIAADEFPRLRVLATGSSTLAATRKFRDSLAGRKRVVELLPVLSEELPAFGLRDLRQRLLWGGLLEPLLNQRRDPEFYREWLDSYFARDVQELFRIGRRHSFLTLVELLLRQSGGLIEVTRLSSLSGLSRPTVMKYLDVLTITHVVHIVRPFAGGGRRELLTQPKLYGFDTGFVAHCNGWEELRDDDCGLLWEHLVLDTLLSISALGKIQFWRDKQHREIDFVLPTGRNRCLAVECKWRAASFDARSLSTFRSAYPHGANYLVTPQAREPYVRRYGPHEVTVCGAAHLRAMLARH